MSTNQSIRSELWTGAPIRLRGFMMAELELDTAFRCLPRLSLSRMLIIIGLAIAAAPGSVLASDPISPAVSAGAGHTCRLNSDGSIACWGLNFDGQASPPAGSFIAMDAGGEHTCGVQSTGAVVCWGRNDIGQGTPTAGSFIGVSAGAFHTCGVRSDGTVACWGYNGFGQASPPAGTFIALSAGYSHTCGLRNDGTVACWGWNAYGQTSSPPGHFVAVSSGAFYACALGSDGLVACWGYNGGGEASPPAGNFIAVGAGNYHTCGVLSDGPVTCWGQNLDGQTNSPAGSFIALSAGGVHTCGVHSDGTVTCWGYNASGQAPKPALLPNTLANGTSNVAYSQAFGLVDPAPSPYTSPTPGFALTSGTLPPGLDLTPAGLLSGTPTTAGSFSFTIEGEDANGFAAQRSYVLAIQGPADSTAPVIVATLAGTLGDNGWYTGNVSITWSVTDDGSTISSTNGCGASSVNSDTSGSVFTCTATSSGGTASETVTVKRDATAPVLAPVATPSVIVLNGSGTAAANASDALSGLASQSCAALATTTTGSRTSSCTATDNAGNSGTGSAAYRVTFAFVGFGSPVDSAPTVNVATAGQTIPFKWRLVDANGVAVTNLASATLSAVSVSCSSSASTDAVEQYAASATALQNLGDGYYQYNWKSPKTFQNTCKQLVLDLGDGSPRMAMFRFK